VIEATVQRARPVILTATAAVFAFIPLTFSAFWGSMAYTLVGGVAGGTALTLVFLPALYATWFKIRPAAEGASDHVAIVHLVGPRHLKRHAYLMTD
jgi:Cu/Ag efflux pump CusA